MEFMGKKIRKGDDLTLERGKSRVTVTFDHEIKDYTDGKTLVGFADDFETVWPFIDSDRWTIVGHTANNVPELPKREGWYEVLGTGSGKPPYTIFHAGENIWFLTFGAEGFAPEPLTPEELRELDTRTLVPMFYKGEVVVSMSSDRRHIYTIVENPGDGNQWGCNCKGYHFRKNCKHVNEWNNLFRNGVTFAHEVD